MPIQKATLKRLGIAAAVLAVIGIAVAAFFILRRSPPPVPAAPPTPPPPKTAKPASPVPAVVSTAPAPGRAESGPAPRERVPEPAAMTPEEAAQAQEILEACGNEISLLCDGSAPPKAQIGCLKENSHGLMSACSKQLLKP